MMIVIDGDRIRAVGRSGSVRVPDSTPGVDGTGRYATQSARSASIGSILDAR